MKIHPRAACGIFIISYQIIIINIGSRIFNNFWGKPYFISSVIGILLGLFVDYYFGKKYYVNEENSEEDDEDK
mgnify:CR=1